MKIACIKKEQADGDGPGGLLFFNVNQIDSLRSERTL